MPYQTIQNFVDGFSFHSLLMMIDMLNKGKSHEEIARCLPVSKRTGKKLSRRRVSQLVAKCFQAVYTPNEVSQFYLDNMMASDQAGVDWARKKLNELKSESERANSELLRYIPGKADRESIVEG